MSELCGNISSDSDSLCPKIRVSYTTQYYLSLGTIESCMNSDIDIQESSVAAFFEFEKFAFIKLVSNLQ
jgi:hypothetical protein